MNIIRPSDFPRLHQTLGQLGQSNDVFSPLGVAIWEWLNPEQVAAEYEALGKTAPEPVGFGDVIGAAVEDTRDVVTGAAEEISEGATQIASGAGKIGIAAVIGLGIVAAVYLTQKRGRK